MSIVNSYLDDIGDVDEIGEDDAIEESEESEELNEDEFDEKGNLATSNVGETSVEINVQDLIAELEEDLPPRPVASEKPARKRLEELLEERRAARELDDDDEFDMTY